MHIGELNGRRLYTGLRLHYRRRLWASTSASRAVSAVAELLVYMCQYICSSRCFRNWTAGFRNKPMWQYIEVFSAYSFLYGLFKGALSLYCGSQSRIWYTVFVFVSFLPDIRYVRVFAIANPSVVCNVRVPYTQGVGNFGNIFRYFVP